MKIRAFTADIESIYWRFHLMIAVVVIAFATGYPLAGIIAAPIFLSALLGVGIVKEPRKAAKQITLPSPTYREQAA
jgi:hypothetical protein